MCISSEIFHYPRVVFSLPCSPSLVQTSSGRVILSPSPSPCMTCVSSEVFQYLRVVFYSSRAPHLTHTHYTHITHTSGKLSIKTTPTIYQKIKYLPPPCISLRISPIFGGAEGLRTYTRGFGLMHGYRTYTPVLCTQVPRPTQCHVTSV